MIALWDVARAIEERIKPPLQSAGLLADGPGHGVDAGLLFRYAGQGDNRNVPAGMGLRSNDPDLWRDTTRGRRATPSFSDGRRTIRGRKRVLAGGPVGCVNSVALDLQGK